MNLISNQGKEFTPQPIETVTGVKGASCMPTACCTDGKALILPSPSIDAGINLNNEVQKSKKLMKESLIPNKNNYIEQN